MNISPKIDINDDLILRKPNKSDVESRLKYGRPIEFRKMVGGSMHNIPTYGYEDATDFYKSMLERELEWVIEYKRNMIGTCRLTLSPDRDRGTYSIGIFDENLYSLGLGTNVTNKIVEFAFNNLKLKSVALVVLEFNKRAIKCYEKCGFVQRRILEDNVEIDGVLFNDLVMVKENITV